MNISRRRLLQLLPFAGLLPRALATAAAQPKSAQKIEVQYLQPAETPVPIRVLDEVWDVDTVYDECGFAVAKVYYPKLTNLVSSAAPLPLRLGNPAPASPERR